MLHTNINEGILFISIEEYINEKTIIDLKEEIDYLLYKQGIIYYAFNFNYIKNISEKFKIFFQNKLTEIFLSCGSVIIYGIDKVYQNIFGNRKTNLYYINDLSKISKKINI